MQRVPWRGSVGASGGSHMSSVSRLSRSRARSPLLLTSRASGCRWSRSRSRRARGRRHGSSLPRLGSRLNVRPLHDNRRASGHPRRDEGRAQSGGDSRHRVSSARSVARRQNGSRRLVSQRSRSRSRTSEGKARRAGYRIDGPRGGEPRNWQQFGEDGLDANGIFDEEVLSEGDLSECKVEDFADSQNEGIATEGAEVEALERGSRSLLDDFLVETPKPRPSSRLDRRPPLEPSMEDLRSPQFAGEQNGGSQGSWRRSRGSRHSRARQHCGSGPIQGKGGDLVLFSQAYISDLPAELGEEELRQLHLDAGLEEAELPLSVKILPPKDAAQETCSCIARYVDETTLQRVIVKLSNVNVTTRSGLNKFIGVNKAKPAKWMVDAGFVREGTGEKRAKVLFSSLPSDCTSVELHKLHSDHGLGAEALPLLSFHASKDPKGETCACTARYRRREDAKRAVETLRGALLITPSGQRHVSLKLMQDELDLENFEFPAGERMDGIVESWNEERAFGFIKPSSGGPDLFLHRREIEDPPAVLIPGTAVTFEAMFTDRGKYEARNCVLVSNAKAPKPKKTALPLEPEDYSSDLDAFIRACQEDDRPANDTKHGVGDIDAEDVAEESKVMGFSYFCTTWDIDKATMAWLARLPRDVQLAIMEEFVDSDRDEDDKPSVVEGMVTLHPTRTLIVTGFSRGVSQAALRELFNRCGPVSRCKILKTGTTALVRMRHLEDAKIAFEDYNMQTPDGLELYGQLSVRFAPADDYKASDRQVPNGQLLVGNLKKWALLQSSGVVELDGFNLELPVSLSDFKDTKLPRIGTTVLVTTTYSEATKLHSISSVYADIANVKAKLSALHGIGKSVRDFARLVRRRLEE